MKKNIMNRAVWYSVSAVVLVATVAGCVTGFRRWSTKVMMDDIWGESLIREKDVIRHDWEMEIEGGHRREYITTNKVATHFSCEAAGRNSRSYHGLYCAMHEYLDSWQLFSDGRLLDPDEITLSRAYPHILYRWYGDQYIMEEIFLPNYENGLVVRFSGLLGDDCELVPWVDMRFMWDAPRPEYRVFWEEKEKVLLISRRDDPFEEGRPRWIAVISDLDMDFEYDEHYITAFHPKDVARKAMGKTNPFTPGRLLFTPYWETPAYVTFVFGLGKTEDEAIEQANIIMEERLMLEQEKFDQIDMAVKGVKKEYRIKKIYPTIFWAMPDHRGIIGRTAGYIDDSRIDSNEVVVERPKKKIKLHMPRFIFEPAYGVISLVEVPLEDRPGIPPGRMENRRAYRWARTSMDNLIMDKMGLGIYAGFHRFPEYRVRDSFISLPGACISTGQYAMAGEILDSFTAYQQDDPESPHLGRLPEVADPDDLRYAGADGTWWFVRAAWKYYESTGDIDFLVRTFPVIRLAIEGALEKAVDEKGFLTHGDGETWMDAGGEHNPCSPRGDRAVEVQALFHHGLLAGSFWAASLTAVKHHHDLEPLELPEDGSLDGMIALLEEFDIAELDSLFGRWILQAALLAGNFREDFIDVEGDYLFDHLNTDGSADRQIRPNAILALWVYLDSVRLAGLPWEKDDADAVAPLSLVSRSRFDSVVRKAIDSIVMVQGVASLSPDDPQFHPYHLDLDSYYYDEAYHNGDVWEWLTGPMISCMVEAGERKLARDLYQPLIDEILYEGAVGSLREIRDGYYTEGKEEFGGATSQACVLAEFIRIALDELGLD